VRTIRIYELDVTYPEGAGTDDGDWEDTGGRELDGSPEERWVWRWPRERRFLSRTSAIARAERLAAMGCTVAVRQSAPIAFEDEPTAVLNAQDPTPPEAECESEPVAWPWEDPNFKPF